MVGVDVVVVIPRAGVRELVRYVAAGVGAGVRGKAATAGVGPVALSLNCGQKVTSRIGFGKLLGGRDVIRNSHNFL
jgi:hypothetical protein